MREDRRSSRLRSSTSLTHPTTWALRLTAAPWVAPESILPMEPPSAEVKRMAGIGSASTIRA